MRTSHSFRSLAFWLHLKPAPRTQSESTAVLNVLQDLGPISTFRFVRQPPHGDKDALQERRDKGALAGLVFAQNTKALDELRKNTSKQKFTVIANPDDPSTRISDPYNVRGLQSRKPELAPRAFECHVVPADEKSDPLQVNSSPTLDAVTQNEYQNPFAVDRHSIFAEILAKTDCPSGLINGLLPKIDNNYPVEADEPVPATVAEEQKRENRHSLLKGYADKPGQDVDFIKLDVNQLQESRGAIPSTKQISDSTAAKFGSTSSNPVNRHKNIQSLLEGYKRSRGRNVQYIRLDLKGVQESEGESPSTDQQSSTDTVLSRDATSNRVDKFKSLRDVSLVKMYREATNQT